MAGETLPIDFFSFKKRFCSTSRHTCARPRPKRRSSLDLLIWTKTKEGLKCPILDLCGASLEINIPFILELTDKEGHEEANIFLSHCFATFFFASSKQDAQRKSQNFFFSFSHFPAGVCGTSEGENGKRAFSPPPSSLPPKGEDWAGHIDIRPLPPCS